MASRSYKENRKRRLQLSQAGGKSARAEEPAAITWQATPEPEWEPPAASILSTPVGFAEGLLGVQLYDWQKEILSWTDDMQAARTKIAVRAPNGSGKSERIIACAALRWVSVAPKGRVVITSKDGRQIDNQVLPALFKRRDRFQDFIWNYRHIVTPTGGDITAFTTDDPGRMEGWHAELPDSPLLIIVDEAKSVEEEIFQAIDRCTFNVLLLISSTGPTQGRFYEAHTSLPNWLTKKVTVDDCPHIPQVDRDDVIATYGIDHPFTRSRLYSEFMEEDEDTKWFVTIGDLDRLYDSPPEPKRGDVIAFCDFAGGGDENVLAVRRGNEVKIVKAWREANEMAAIGEFITLFRAQQLKPSDIWADNGGAGKAMIARFWEMGWPINRVDNGAAANNKRDYTNRGTEIWDIGATAIKRLNIILPNDPVLRKQCCSRKKIYRSDGRIMAESKEDMRKRGVKSPDRSDAVMAAIALAPPQTYNSYDALMPEWLQSVEGDYRDVESRIAGVAGD